MNHKIHVGVESLVWGGGGREISWLRRVVPNKI